MADKTEKKPGFVARMKGFGANIAKFFRDTKSELKKVVWPTGKQVVNNVLITLACVVVVGVFIWIFDLGGNLIVEGIISLVKG